MMHHQRLSLFLLLLISQLLPTRAGSCESRILLTNSSGVITDGIGEYKDYESCMFIIQLNDTNQRIQLTFHELLLECGWDYFNIFDGDTLQHPKLMSLSGDQVNSNGMDQLSQLQVISSSSSLLLLFLSDAGATALGFNLTYSSIPNLSQTSNLTSGVCYSDCNQTCYLHNDTLLSQCSIAPTVSQDDIIATTFTSISPPLPRAGHTTVLYSECIYVYGGYTFESQFDIPNYHYSLFKRCLPSEDWETVIPGPSTGPWPAPRYGHTSILYKDAMYVYGGTIISYGTKQVRNEITNEMWRLNFTSMTWTYLSSSNLTLSTTGHVSELVSGGRMVVLFGQSRDQADLLSPREYLIDSDQWVYYNNSKAPFSEKLVYSASAYSPLYNLVFIYGGTKSDKSIHTTLYAYLPDAHSWLYFPSNPFYTTVYQHAVVLLNDSYLLTTGGYAATGVCGFAPTFVYDLRCGRWHQLDTLSQASFNLREGHTLTTHTLDTVLMFGGYNHALLFNDLVTLHLPDFSSLFNSSSCPDKIRCQHLSCTQCLAASECEWEDTLCQPAASNISFNSSQNTSAVSLCPPLDDGCTSVSSCWECQVRPGCVWDNNDCRMKQQANETSSSCAPGCGSFSCTECIDKLCLYCPSQDRCITGDYPIEFPYGQCLIWTKNLDSCPTSTKPDPCVSYKTCKECQSDFNCGWCSTHFTGLGECMESSLEGSFNRTNSCSNNNWYYFDCPPCQCNGHSICNDSAECVQCMNNTQGEHCETCAAWFYGESRNGGSCSPCQCTKYGALCDSLNGHCLCNAYGVSGNHCERCDYNGTVNTSCFRYQEPLTIMRYTSTNAYSQSMLFMTRIAEQEQVTMKFTISPFTRNGYAFVHLYRAVDSERKLLESLSPLLDQLSSEVREELLMKLAQNTSNMIVEVYGEFYELKKLDALVLLVANNATINTSNYPSYLVYTQAVQYQITPEDLETDNDYIFFEFANHSHPFSVTVDMASEEVPLIVAVLVFLSVVLIFFIIMVLILLGWHIKKQIEFRQARVRRKRERVVMATRPASVTSLLATSVGPNADNIVMTRAIADQPLANSKVSLSTFLISMPNNSDDPSRMPLYCGTALVTTNKSRESKIFSNPST